MNVRFSPTAASDFEALPRIMKARVQKVIARLHNWPHVSGVKPLTGPLAGHYRVRTGDYRVQFAMRDQVLWIEKIGHRDGFYEE
ncbi:MAG: type II toxin-antitoxin system RelE family toxin [Phycisphaerae bacterium]